MSISTASRDSAGIKRALELGLILAALVIATIMIVTAAHDDARKLTSDITTGQGAAVMGAGAHHCAPEVRAGRAVVGRTWRPPVNMAAWHSLPI
jgi:hypothetical protein